MTPNTPRHFINLPEIPPGTLRGLIRHARQLKALKHQPPQMFSGLSLAMLFDKRSTRTRVSFEVAMKQLGGHSVVMSKEESQIGGAESIESTAKVLSRFVDAIMVRMSNHRALEELAHHATIPVINGMTDRSHPCQIIASLMTIEEHLGSINGRKLAWFGDYNNVARTYVLAAPLFGYEMVVSGPEEVMPPSPDFPYEPDPKKAAHHADVLITDTWVSMGQEGKGIEPFLPYQVNSTLMSLARPHAIFTHCLPIHEWEEVSEEVAKSSASVIYDEAENRLHAQKAVLAWCLKDAGVKIPRPEHNNMAHNPS
ncbi:ornithine carbamoyltransferase [Haematospirillum sp. 15-248]|uniref:ornithine carbamoyltransferase n=1 Tax=Haematospirillum sp. 15-248 TaxID=2723107 RepID=UPI0014393765|nr:ornithine carbamoyltransferase [Haematospirillum sp. 15-248]NKD87708.1 ornithine carbamoyltransferase [Haematospirillum sp. 15-248]